MKPWGHLVSLPPCLLTAAQIQPAQHHLSLSPLSVSRWLSLRLFPPRNKRVNSSDSRPSCGTISGAEKGETVCRKREEGKRRVFALNADQLAGPGSVCVCVCMCACAEFSHRAQAHLALSDNTTGLFSASRKKKKKKQNFPLLRIQS